MRRFTRRGRNYTQEVFVLQHLEQMKHHTHALGPVGSAKVFHVGPFRDAKACRHLLMGNPLFLCRFNPVVYLVKECGDVQSIRVLSYFHVLKLQEHVLRQLHQYDVAQVTLIVQKNS